MNHGLEIKLSPENASQSNVQRLDQLDEKTFRWMLNEEEVGNEKLAEGIRLFSKDTNKLEEKVRNLIKF